jgi:hypothetical protein
MIHQPIVMNDPNQLSTVGGKTFGRVSVFARADFQEWVLAQFPWTSVGQYFAMGEPEAEA